MLNMHTVLCRSLLLALISCLAASASLAGEEFPRELVEFQPYSGNPVFTAAGEGHWDVKIRERAWILRDEKEWRMWYTGYDGTPEGIRRLGYATSTDGLAWKRAGDVPQIAEGWVEDAQVLRHGNGYLMFAEGERDRAQWFTSPDGLVWKREGTLDIRQVNGQPISDGAFGTPAAFFEEGRWNLFYERGDRGVWLARSDDLKVWTNVQDDPVLSLGDDSYDSFMIAVNQIVKHDGRYYAYYHGTGSREKPRLWSTNVAVSTDLVHWKKYSRNPLLPERDNKSSGFLVHDGTRYRLYTTHEKVDVHLPAGSQQERPAE